MSWSYLAAFWKSIASDSRLPTNLPTRTSDLPPMIYRAEANEDIELLARRQTFKRRHAVRNAQGAFIAIKQRSRDVSHLTPGRGRFAAW
jgi:hypothetical protein